MRSPAVPSIDQLLVLLTVAEAGSFTAAAKRLGRATSAISYAIDTLEAAARSFAVRSRNDPQAEAHTAGRSGRVRSQGGCP